MSPGDRPAVPSDQSPIAGPDRVTVLTSAALIALASAAWVHVVWSAVGGAHDGTGSGVSAGLGYVTAWAVMMAAMMLPSAVPMITFYGAIQRKTPGAVATGAPVAVFALVYLVLWAAAGVPVYVASRLLDGVDMDTLHYGVAAALLVAGVYQFTPLKHACLRVCRSPLGFLLGRWRDGYFGSLAMGWAHAVYCLGCCWALMIVLVAAGAMGLPWVLLIAAVVAAEKLVPRGEWVARAVGGVLVLLGVAVALSPGLATVLRGSHAM